MVSGTPQSDDGGLALITWFVGGITFVALLGLILWAMSAMTPSDPEVTGETSMILARDITEILVRPGTPSWTTHVDALVLQSAQPGFGNGQGILDVPALDLLNRGEPEVTDASNGYLDMPELMAAMDIDDRGIHIRAYPSYTHNPACGGGESGIDAYRVALLEPAPAERGTRQWESSILARLCASYTNASYDPTTGTGSNVEMSTAASNITPHLTPRFLGFAYQEYRGGLPRDIGDYGWSLAEDGGTWLARFGDGTDIAYNSGEEDRLASPRIEAAGVSRITLTWRERVTDDGTTPAIDRGVVQVGTISVADVTTWLPDDATSSTDTAGAWVARSATFVPASPFEGGIRVAFTWIASAVPPRALVSGGWEIDDIVVKDDSGRTLWTNDFELDSAGVDAVIVGSGASVDHTIDPLSQGALTAFVSRGGALIILPTSGDPQAFEDSFGLVRSDTTNGTKPPRHKHPVLVTPNALATAWYPESGTWTVPAAWSGTYDPALVSKRLESKLLVDRRGRLGEGTVIASAFALEALPAGDDLRFLANTLMFAANRDLYAEAGPPIPTDHEVGTSSSILFGRGSDRAEDVVLLTYVWYEGRPS